MQRCIFFKGKMKIFHETIYRNGVKLSDNCHKPVNDGWQGYLDMDGSLIP